jgi:arabinan endo-1,5-alpha-L-arabinosidase
MRAIWLLALLAPLCGAISYKNPVIPDADTPDPGLAFDAATGAYYAATTTGGAPCFSLHKSSDLVNWEAIGHMFPGAPAWAQASDPACWAPELHYVPSTRAWVAFYVARSAASGLLSIGAATSAGGPGGPWADLGAPLVEDAGAGAQGQIDPTLAWSAAGAPVLLFKEDGNADGRPTPIHFAALAPNATALAAPAGAREWKATALIRDGLPWEHGIVEAPWVVQRGGEFFLFYSGSGYTSGYAVGVARAPALEGPFVKWGPPILRQNESSLAFESPGHCSVLQLPDGKWAMVYHAWLGPDRAARHLMLDELMWGADGWPFLQGGVPSTEEHAAP